VPISKLSNKNNIIIVQWLFIHPL